MNNETARKTGLRCAHVAIHLIVLSCLLRSAQATDEAPVSEAAPEAFAVEVFKGAQLLSTKGVAYPESERRNGNEGWVQLNMMIDPRGKAYEVTVVDSTGNEALEKAAVQAVQRFSYAPATRGGTPIDSSLNFKVKFFLRGPASGAAPEFVRAYRDVAKAVEEGDRARADEAFAKLQVQNLYEEAYKHLSSYHYHRKWGTEQEQLADLRGAVAAESGPRYLPKATFIAVLTELLALEIKFQDYGRALGTWKDLQSVAPKKSLVGWQSPMDRILVLRDDDRVVRLSGQITKGTSWNGQLFKKRFAVAIESGQVAEIKLRCEKQYLFFRYEPGVQYKVDARDGDCSIELVGDPGTKFELVQS